MAKVFISGSISLKALDTQAIAHLDSIVTNRHIVLIGDAPGVDKAIQQYLFERNYQSVIVYYSGDQIRNNISHWETKQISNENHLTGKKRYQLKDEAMAQDADCGLMIWDGKSRGTKYNIDNMTRLDKLFTVIETTPAIKLYEQLGYTCIDTVDLGLPYKHLKWFRLYEMNL